MIVITKAMTNAVGKSGCCCGSGVEVGSWEGVGVGEVVGSGDDAAPSGNSTVMLSMSNGAISG